MPPPDDDDDKPMTFDQARSLTPVVPKKSADDDEKPQSFDEAVAQRGILSNVGKDETFAGPVKNIASTALHSLAASKAAAPGLYTMLTHDLPAAVTAQFSDRTTKQIKEDWEAKELAEREKKLAAARKRYAEMPEDTGWQRQEKAALKEFIDIGEAYKKGYTEENVYKANFAPTFGDYEPQTWWGRQGRAAGTMLFPSMLGGGGSWKSLAAGTAKPVSVGTVLTGLGTGAGAQQLSEMFPDNPNYALGFSLLAPALTHGGMEVKKRLSPPDPETTFRKASQKLAGMATEEDKQKLWQDAKTKFEQQGLVEGEVPPGEFGPGAPKRMLPQGTQTIGELTGDEGLIDVERAARSSSKASPSEVMTDTGKEPVRTIDQMKTERAEGRVEAGKTTLTADSTPNDVANFIAERQKALDAASAADLGEPMGAGERGGILQKTAQKGEAWYKALTNRLYKAVDPVRQFRMLWPGVRGAVDKIRNEAAEGFGDQPTDVVGKQMDKTSQWPQIVGYWQLRQYLEALNGQIRKVEPTATGPGDPPTYRHLLKLKEGVDSDINDAIRNQVEHEDMLVKNGHMVEGDTVRSRLMALEAEGKVPTLGPTEPTNIGPNLTQEAGQRLAEARKARVEQGRIFDDPTVRSIIGAGESDVGGLTAKAFPGKGGKGIDTGGEITRKVLEATKNSPQAIAALQAHAIDLLKSMGETARDVTGNQVTRITPEVLQKFRDKYGSSLQALEDAQPGFLSKFDNVVNVQSELARQFLDDRSGAKGGEASRAVVGDLLNDRKNGPTKVQALLREVGGDHNVVEGLKHLIVENLFNSSLDTIADQPHNFNGTKFMRLMNQNKALLEAAGFSPEHMRVWEAIAKDFGSQAQHENIAVKGKLRQGPTTMTNKEAIERAFGDEKADFKEVTLGREAATVAGVHDPYWYAPIRAAEWGLNKLRLMAHNAKLAGIKNANDLIRAGIIDPNLGIRMLRVGAEKVTDPTYGERVSHGLRESEKYAIPGAVEGGRTEEERRKRRGHAGGGGVTADHTRAATHLIGLVERARKMDQRDTKPLLQSHDTAVASALANAARGIG